MLSAESHRDVSRLCTREFDGTVIRESDSRPTDCPTHIETKAAEMITARQARRWLRAVEETPHGANFLSNLLHDRAHGSPPLNDVKELLRQAIEQWSANEQGQDPVACVVRCARADSDRFECRGPQVGPPAAGCTRVMAVLEFIRHNIAKSKMSYVVTDRVARTTIADWENGLEPDEVENMMQTSRQFAWLTSKDALDATIAASKEDHLAGKVRDELGLRSLMADEELVALTYPAGCWDTTELRAPTFVEGSPELIFRCDRTMAKWGRAVNLRTLAPGLPEAVHRPVRFTAEFRVRYLGRIHSITINVDWTAFARTGAYPYDGEKRRDVLELLLT